MSGLSVYAVHESRELDITSGEAATVVGGQGHLNAVVNVKPLRVMIELLGAESHSGHEPESLIEPPKLEFSADGISFGLPGPVRKLLSGFFPLF